MIRIAAFLLAMAPGAALANAGVGYFTVAMPLVVLALVPAVLLEAPLLRAVQASRPRAGASIALVPWYFLSWWIDPALDGRRIELNPQRDDSSGGLRWICSSPDIEPRYLPASCRPQAK